MKNDPIPEHKLMSYGLASRIKSCEVEFEEVHQDLATEAILAT